MARPLRLDYPGALYPVTSRGKFPTKDKREKLITDAHVSCGYTLKEIADHLHLHYATISRAVKRTMETNV